MSKWHRYRATIQSLAAKPITSSVVLSLRKECGEELTRELIEVASIQAKAIKKFGEGVWMATSRAIEQASDRSAAAYKASLMKELDILDLCGGIGGDAMGFAACGRVVTVDRDPQMTSMAAENLRSIETTQAAAVCADVERFVKHLGGTSLRCGIHIDPDRRADNRRTIDPFAYSPGLDFVNHVAATAQACWVKLAPAAELPQDVSQTFHRQWISVAGSVREQSLLRGDCFVGAGLQRNERSAVKVHRDGASCTFACSMPESGSNANLSSSPLSYLYDLDPAVRAAGLSEAFAIRHSLNMLSDASGFFTSDHAIPVTPLVQSFKTIWTGPADLKQIKKQLSLYSCSLQAIKVRGTDHDPAKLAKQLKQSDAHERIAAVLLIGRIRGGVFAAIGTPTAH